MNQPPSLNEIRKGIAALTEFVKFSKDENLAEVQQKLSELMNLTEKLSDDTTMDEGESETALLQEAEKQLNSIISMIDRK